MHANACWAATHAGHAVHANARWAATHEGHAMHANACWAATYENCAHHACAAAFHGHAKRPPEPPWALPSPPKLLEVAQHPHMPERGEMRHPNPGRLLLVLTDYEPPARYLCARTPKLRSCARAPLPPVWKTLRKGSERQKVPKRMPDLGRIAAICKRVLFQGESWTWLNTLICLREAR
eukprot:250241-Chlamydomonas_euryale.AAC.1